MKTNSLTHGEITQRAQKIWQDYGKPAGRDTEIWLEAEQQLAAGLPGADSGAREPSHPVSEAKGAAALAERLKGEMASESAVEYHISPPIPEEKAIKAALQKRAARSPKVSHKMAPKPTPPESGKPLWNQPHSS